MYKRGTFSLRLFAAAVTQWDVDTLLTHPGMMHYVGMCQVINLQCRSCFSCSHLTLCMLTQAVGQCKKCSVCQE